MQTSIVTLKLKCFDVLQLLERTAATASAARMCNSNIQVVQGIDVAFMAAALLQGARLTAVASPLTPLCSSSTCSRSSCFSETRL